MRSHKGVRSAGEACPMEKKGTCTHRSAGRPAGWPVSRAGDDLPSLSLAGARAAQATRDCESRAADRPAGDGKNARALLLHRAHLAILGTHRSSCHAAQPMQACRRRCALN